MQKHSKESIQKKVLNFYTRNDRLLSGLKSRLRNLFGNSVITVTFFFFEGSGRLRDFFGGGRGAEVPLQVSPLFGVATGFKILGTRLHYGETRTSRASRSQPSTYG